MDKVKLSLRDVTNACISLHAAIYSMGLKSTRNISPWLHIYGIPRGGVSSAFAFLSSASSTVYAMTEDPFNADIILDDLIDSGSTMNRYMLKYPGKIYAALFSKAQESRGRVIVGSVTPDAWLVFPWEGDSDNDNDKSADDIPIRLLQYIGEDVTREGLKDTPARFLKAWKEWTSGYDMAPADVLKVFTDGAKGVDEMIVVKDIPVYSHCEHHLAPFFGVAHVSYVPSGKIVGLSKIPRVVDMLARRLQVQERLTQQIAEAIDDVIQPKGVGIILECRHMCMESRGIQRTGCTTTTSAMRGVMLNNPAARAELLALIRK